MQTPTRLRYRQGVGPVRSRSLEAPSSALTWGTILGGLALTAAGAAAAVAAYRRAKEAERRYPPIGRRIEIDGVGVQVAEWGQGAPIVLVHGNGTMIHDWPLSGLVERLAPHFRVVAIDRPGYGYSERPRSRIWTAEAQADLVAGVIRRLGLRKPLVLGHSWGSITTIALGLRHPDLLRGLILLGGYYFPTARPDVWLFSGPAVPGAGDVARYTIAPILTRMIADRLIENVFAPRPVPQRFADHFPLELSLRPWQIRASAADSALMVPASLSLQGGYGDLQVPAVIMYGDGDRVVHGDKQSRRLADELPQGELITLPGVGHMVHYDRHAQDLIVQAASRLHGQAAKTGNPAGATRQRARVEAEAAL